MYILILNTSILVFANSVADGQEKTNVDVQEHVLFSECPQIISIFCGPGVWGLPCTLIEKLTKIEISMNIC